MSLSKNVENKFYLSNRIYWCFFVLSVLMLFFFDAYFYKYVPVFNNFRLFFNVTFVFLLVIMFAFTKKSRVFFAFFKEAKVELRKVIWPVRRDVFHSALMIAIVVIIVALFLWGVDSCLMFIISLFTEQRS